MWLLNLHHLAHHHPGPCAQQLLRWPPDEGAIMPGPQHPPAAEGSMPHLPSRGIVTAFSLQEEERLGARFSSGSIMPPPLPAGGRTRL